MGIRGERVLRAVEQVPRGLFVPEPLREEAEADRPLPIGYGQTISQPYIVAFMTDALGLGGDERVLEVGTGSGYQAAILALLAKEVFSVEIVPELAARAAHVLLVTLRLGNVRLRVGDGRLGWPEAAPFDRIIVTAAPDHIPQPLIDQLKPGGRMVVPVGPHDREQELLLVTKDAAGRAISETKVPVSFVPLTRESR